MELESYLDDNLKVLDNLYRSFMSTMEDTERKMDRDLDEFYTRYVSMPYMGNFSYIDPLNPLSLY